MGLWNDVRRPMIELIAFLIGLATFLPFIGIKDGLSITEAGIMFGVPIVACSILYPLSRYSFSVPIFVSFGWLVFGLIFLTGSFFAGDGKAIGTGIMLVLSHCGGPFLVVGGFQLYYRAIAPNLPFKKGRAKGGAPLN